MTELKISNDVSIRFTLTLQDGEPVANNLRGDRLGYSPGQKQIMPALEEALQGAVKGEKRQIILSPEHDPNLMLDATRLAHLLGHPGETLILDVEII
jgi:hypothetical protein